MSPVSLLPLLPILGLALLSMYVISRFVKITPEKGHNIAIDGLRGYLAFFVFLHHSCIWYFFLRFHQWSLPPSRAYDHFGPTSVALFFMITAYLFFSKLLDASGGTMDWVKLYVGRICRILPLYGMVLASLLYIIGTLTGFQLREPPLQLFGNVGKWRIPPAKYTLVF